MLVGADVLGRIEPALGLVDRDLGTGVNYTFCTEPYDVIPHESPHFLDCAMIPANALGRSRYFTYRASITDSYTLLTAKTCELVLRMRGTVVNKGVVPFFGLNVEQEGDDEMVKVLDVDLGMNVYW